MILLQSLKKELNLIDKGSCYFLVTSCLLDNPSPKITNWICQYDVTYALMVLDSTVVKCCSLYQVKDFQ